MTQILAIDIGTGTQDIFLFRPGVGLENGFKLVLPSATMILRRRIEQATLRGDDLLLTGVTMGGGPCAWAAEAHLRLGHKVYATPAAARTFNDDLEWVQREMGVRLVSEKETTALHGVTPIEFKDLDLPAVAAALAPFGVDLKPSLLAVAVFDHGAAPPGVSDRQFRFDYLAARIREVNRLSAFAYRSSEVPPFLTRLLAVAESAGDLRAPVIVMDTAPAAVLGATLDTGLAVGARRMVVNVGNFHTLAFRLGPQGIEGVFEHHTGLLDLPKLEGYLQAFAAGSLTHRQVFDDMGHGAVLVDPRPLMLEDDGVRLAVTGPRRSMLRGSRLKPYFAVPFGDMMMAGCFGLLAASADLLPEFAEVIHRAFDGKDEGTAPWDVPE